jgi:hypothetical protein
MIISNLIEFEYPFKIDDLVSSIWALPSEVLANACGLMSVPKNRNLSLNLVHSSQIVYPEPQLLNYR